MNFDDLEFDCQSCGACCRAHPNYEGANYVRIYDEDAERMTQKQRQLYTVKLRGNKHAMRLVGDKRCAALEGEIGGCVSCRIYDNRPEVCRNFERGDDSCRFARMEAGLGPFGQ